MLTAAIILAAGKGTRMKSNLPKVLHQVAGKPMLAQVLSEVEKAKIGKSYVIVGHGEAEVNAALKDKYQYESAVQRPQLGTGHCVMQAIPLIPIETEGVLVICGDTPLLPASTLSSLKLSFEESDAACVILTAVMENPSGYGRILRNDEGDIIGIVEDKDATMEQRQIQEVNTGTYFFNYHLLTEALANLDNNNSQGEYYLTDTLAYFAANNHKIVSLISDLPEETMGVNDRYSLAVAELFLRKRKNNKLMHNGVTIIDPASTYIDLDVQIGQDTIIYPNCHLHGNTVIGSNCVINPDCQITDSTIGNNCNITKSVINQSTVGNNANIGPFAYLRPGTVLADNVKIGDFVEVKNSSIGTGSKLPHLSYVGDSTVGSKVNIGCGTITCNYDGAYKYQTTIEDGAFIGSNSNLVAPVTIGVGAFIAAGSTITNDVKSGDLAVARGKQRNIANWVADKAPKKPQA